MGNYEAFDTFLNCVGLTYRLRRVLIFAYIGLGLLVAGAVVYSALTAGYAQAQPIHRTAVSTNTVNTTKASLSSANIISQQPSCYLLPNLTKLDTFGLDSNGAMLVNGTVNFVTPNYTGVTVNGNSYQIYENNTYTVSTSPQFTLELISTSYIPIAHSVDMQLCSASQLQNVVLILPPHWGGSAAAFNIGGGSGGGGGGPPNNNQPGDTYYSVTFIATNLPNGISWNLNVNGTSTTSASNSISVNLTAGSYHWNAIIIDSGNYVGSPVSGSISVNSSLTKTILLNYSKITPPKNNMITLTISANPVTTNTPDLIAANVAPATDYIEILVSNSIKAGGTGEASYVFNSKVGGNFNVTALDSNTGLETTETLYVEPKTTSALTCRATDDRTITLTPAKGNSYYEIISAFDQLGEDGGGILRLDAGTYYIDNGMVMNYSNVVIVGGGVGNTILSLPPDPRQNYYTASGQLVGTYNDITGKGVGPAVNLFHVEPDANITGFGICNVTINANINSTAEDWEGGLIVDNSGGRNHTYENIKITNLDGLNPGPNGMNIGCYSTPKCNITATNYLINNITANSDEVKMTGYNRSGPGVLVLHGLSNSKVMNVTATGVVEFDEAPSTNSIFENWNFKGRMLIDPFLGGSWNNSVFDHIVFNVTSFPLYVQHSDSIFSMGEHTKNAAFSNFSDLYIINSEFVGGYTGKLGNAYAIENTVFVNVTIDSIPEYFINNTVIYHPWNSTHELPILVGGKKYTVSAVTMENNTWIFPEGTNSMDPFKLQANTIVWKNDKILIEGKTSGYLFEAPNVIATANSIISGLNYTPSGGAPNTIALLDAENSIGFIGTHIKVGNLRNIIDNINGSSESPPTLNISSNPTTVDVPDKITAEANPTSDHVEILISNSVVASGKGNATYSFDPQYPGTYNVVALDTNSQLETAVALVVKPTIPKHGGSFECGSAPNRTITLSPAQGNSYNEIVASMIKLGKEGGGIIRLDSGTYYLYNEININYSNVAIIGDGMGKTIISMPPDPIQNFTIEPQGVPVGTYNSTTGVQEGPAGHLFEVRQWVAGIGLCNLTLDGNIHSLNEDWAGSLILDTFGGKNHTYENIAMVNLDGLEPGPNGVNIGCPQTPCVRAASGYLIKNLIAMNDDIAVSGVVHGGPGFLVVRMLSNTTITGVKGMGVIEFDGPAIDSMMSNWSVDGHLLLEPFPVPWGNSTFDNVTFNVTRFPSNSPHAATTIEIAQMVIPGTHGVRGATNFTGLRIINSKFVGGDAQGLGNAYYVENSVFDTAIDSIPEYFINDTVVYPTSGRTWFPIAIGGAKYTATSVTMENDKFEFMNGTGESDPFILQANTITWKNSEIVIKGHSTGYLFDAPNVIATANSTISDLSYVSFGDDAPKVISLLDAGNSDGFVGIHIRIDGLINIMNNIDGGEPAGGEASQSKSASAPITIILQNSSIIYGTSDMITATAANSKDTVILEINKESIAQGKGKAKYNAAQLPAGVQVIYAYDVSTGADAMVTVNISKATPQLNLTVPSSYIYNGIGGEIRYSISTINNQLTAVLIVNNKTVGNTKSASKYTTKKSIGNYVAIVETPGNANYIAENTLVSNFTIINPRSV